MDQASDDLPYRLLALLSDGLPRRITTLTQHLSIPESELETALARLRAIGLEWLDRGQGAIGLSRAFVPLNAARIRERLALLGIVASVEVSLELASTNSELLERARRTSPGAAPICVLATEFQSAGRGRQGRVWHAFPGSSLCVSFSLELPRALGDLSGLSLVCGLAVRDALARHRVQAQLKWPNDLLVAGKKLGGILVEVHPLGSERTVAVIGVGLNVHPDERRDEALAAAPASLAVTDLESAGAGPGIDRNHLLADVADTLSACLPAFGSTGFAPFQTDWNAHHAFTDLPVEVVERGALRARGIARGVDSAGRLVLDSDGTRQSLVAGEITLRPL